MANGKQNLLLIVVQVINVICFPRDMKRTTNKRIYSVLCECVRERHSKVNDVNFDIIEEIIRHRVLHAFAKSNVIVLNCSYKTFEVNVHVIPLASTQLMAVDGSHECYGSTH